LFYKPHFYPYLKAFFMPRLYLHVALPVPLRKTFDYSIPASLHGTPHIGARVRVPFGRRELIGVILAVDEHTDSPIDKIKPARHSLTLIRFFHRN
jgi:primosomal protein N' (replication factor Y)